MNALYLNCRAHKKLIVLITLCLTFSLLVSCQAVLPGDSQPSLEPQATIKTSRLNEDILDKGPVKGGTLNLFSVYPDTYDPLRVKKESVVDFLSFIFEGLVQLDKNQRAIPLLSDNWMVSPDGLTWTFHIREGVRWHDGSLLTAYDVEYTMNEILSITKPSLYKNLLLNIATFSANTPDYFRIVLRKPDSFTAHRMIFPVISKKINEYSSSASIMGTGPYMFESEAKLKEVVLKRNEMWWGLSAGTEIEKGRCYIDKISIKLYNTSDEAINAFQDGKVDVVKVNETDFNKYEGRTDLNIKKYSSRIFEFLAFNLDNPVFQDINTRKAIYAAIRRDETVKVDFYGHALAVDFPVCPESWLMEGLTPYSPHSDSVAAYLEAGGWKLASGKYYKSINNIKKELKIEMLVNANNSMRIMLLEKFCSRLREAGISAEVKPVAWEELMVQIDLRKFDIVYTGVNIGMVPDISFLYSKGYFASEASPRPQEARNIANYSNSIIDSKLDAFYSEHNANTIKMYFDNIRATAFNDMPYIGICFLQEAMVYSKHIRGLTESYTWNRYNDITKWYLPG